MTCMVEAYMHAWLLFAGTLITLEVSGICISMNQSLLECTIPTGTRTQHGPM